MKFNLLVVLVVLILVALHLFLNHLLSLYSLQQLLFESLPSSLHRIANSHFIGLPDDQTIGLHGLSSVVVDGVSHGELRQKCIFLVKRLI